MALDIQEPSATRLEMNHPRWHAGSHLQRYAQKYYILLIRRAPYTSPLGCKLQRTTETEDERALRLQILSYIGST